MPPKADNTTPESRAAKTVAVEGISAGT